MFKETVITVIIVIFVIIGHIVTINYTKDTVITMQDKLAKIKEELIKEDENETKNQIQEIENEWNSRKKKLSFYLEHDELEKIEAEITTLRANIETEEYDDGIETLEKCDFLLEHVKDKEAINLENIF